jgi:hypothetical protein
MLLLQPVHFRQLLLVTSHLGINRLDIGAASARVGQDCLPPLRGIRHLPQDDLAQSLDPFTDPPPWI